MRRGSSPSVADRGQQKERLHMRTVGASAPRQKALRLSAYESVDWIAIRFVGIGRHRVRTIKTPQKRRQKIQRFPIGSHIRGASLVGREVLATTIPRSHIQPTATAPCFCSMIELTPRHFGRRGSPCRSPGDPASTQILVADRPPQAPPFQAPPREHAFRGPGGSVRRIQRVPAPFPHVAGHVVESQMHWADNCRRWQFYRGPDLACRSHKADRHCNWTSVPLLVRAKAKGGCCSRPTGVFPLCFRRQKIAVAPVDTPP